MSIFSHRHRWEAAAVDQQRTSVFGPLTARATFILWRCGCGDVRSVQVAGWWTLKQVRGEREAQTADGEVTA